MGHPWLCLIEDLPFCVFVGTPDVWVFLCLTDGEWAVPAASSGGPPPPRHPALPVTRSAWLVLCPRSRPTLLPLLT